jgi:flagellar assembly protein FliH
VIHKHDTSDTLPDPSEAVSAPGRQGVQEFEPRQVQMRKRRPDSAGQGQRDLPVPLLTAGEEPLHETDREAIERHAFQHGYDEGEKAGIERAAGQYREAIAAFGRSALQVVTLKSRLRAEAERELVELAFAISRRILRREISVDPTAVVGLIRSCMEQHSRTEIHRLHVNPQDHALVAEFFQQSPGPRPEVVADPKVGRGGAVLETARGVLDAKVETQLEEIEKGLADR